MLAGRARMCAAGNRPRRSSSGARNAFLTRSRARRSNSGMTARRRRDLELAGLALAMMAAFAAVHLIALDVPWLRRLELFTLDLKIRLHGAQAAGPETVIVMIDDRTIAELGRWPIPRRKLADVVTRLHAAGAKVVGIDILLADPEPAAAADGGMPAGNDGDVALARAIRDAGNVVLPFTFRFAGH